MQIHRGSLPMTTRTGILLGLCLFLAVPVTAKAQPTKTEPWFRDATKEYGPIGGGPPAFADLDGDGFPDLICDGKIYKNDGGKRFIDVTKESGDRRLRHRHRSPTSTTTACPTSTSAAARARCTAISARCASRTGRRRCPQNKHQRSWPPRSATSTATATSICTSPTTRTGRTTPIPYPRPTVQERGRRQGLRAVVGGEGRPGPARPGRHVLRHRRRRPARDLRLQLPPRPELPVVLR